MAVTDQAAENWSHPVSFPIPLSVSDGGKWVRSMSSKTVTEAAGRSSPKSKSSSQGVRVARKSVRFVGLMAA